MKKNIASVLEELYQLDPSLKKQEKELIKIIKYFLDKKPQADIDERFVKKLQKKLNQKAADKKTNLNTNFFKMINRIIYPFGGGIIATLLIITVIQGLPFKLTENTDSTIDFRQKNISQLKEGAFGKLPNTDTNVTPESLSRMVSSKSVGIGGGGSAMAENTMTESAVINPASDSKIMPYNPKTYEYNYTGETVDLSANKVTVYKRISDKINTSSLAKSIESFGFNLANIGKFKNLNVASIQLLEERKFGYRININFNDNTFDIYQDWEQWPDVNDKCKGDSKCYENNRLKTEDIPNDQKLIQIANQFLDQHDIKKENYGDPLVQKSWEREIALLREADQPESQVYVPDNIQIIYPHLIEGKMVYDQNGNPMGLNVGVNIRYNLVSHVNNLQIEKYESSNYDAVTDWSSIDKYLKSGATNYQPQNVEKISANLDKAEIVLMSLWHYDESTGQGTQYFTPAIKFNIPEGQIENSYRENIMVPLAKELFDTNTQSMIEPRPLIAE